MTRPQTSVSSVFRFMIRRPFRHGKSRNADTPSARQSSFFFFWKMSRLQFVTIRGNVGAFDGLKVAIDGSNQTNEGSEETTKGNIGTFDSPKETNKGSKETTLTIIMPSDGPKVTIKGSKVTIKGNIGTINGSKEATNGSNRAIEGSNRVHDGSKETMKGNIGTTSGQKEAIPNSIRLHNGPKVTIEGSKVSFMGNVGTIKDNIGTIYGQHRTINGSMWAIAGRHHVFRPSLADDEPVSKGDSVERIATAEHIVHVRDLGRVEGGEAERCQGRKRWAAEERERWSRWRLLALETLVRRHVVRRRVRERARVQRREGAVDGLAVAADVVDEADEGLAVGCAVALER